MRKESRKGWRLSGEKMRKVSKKGWRLGGEETRKVSKKGLEMQRSTGATVQMMGVWSQGISKCV
jgi:hypothetical protein